MGNKYGYNGAGGGHGGGFGGNNMQSLMKQAQQMQQKLQEAQQELEDLQVVGAASGGMVEVVCNGKKTVLSVKVQPQACDPDDVEMLEDLILAGRGPYYGAVRRNERFDVIWQITSNPSRNL